MPDTDDRAACPACGEPAVGAATWCEACGADLDGPAPSPPCADCGAPGEGVVDGYCGSCGARQPGRHDHVVVDLGWLAAVTHKGSRRAGNEDAFSVADADGTAVIVVCDGVGSTDSPAAAARAAATAAGDALSDDLGSVAVVTEVDLTKAAAAAQSQVIAVTQSDPPRAGDLPPSATLVVAVARADADGVSGVVGWLGDSRAYWVGAEALRLTDDHVYDGPPGDEQSGSITRWLGLDAADVTPSSIDFRAQAPGLLIVCTDGLWRYLDEPQALAATVGRLRTDNPQPVQLAQALVDYANSSGGHDNITVAIAEFGPNPGGDAT